MTKTNEVVQQLAGIVVYEAGVFGKHSPNHGQEFSRRRVITDANNIGRGGYWVRKDATGKSYALILDGILSEYVATKTDGGFELPPELSLTPRGQVI